MVLLRFYAVLEREITYTYICCGIFVEWIPFLYLHVQYLYDPSFFCFLPPMKLWSIELFAELRVKPKSWRIPTPRVNVLYMHFLSPYIPNGLEFRPAEIELKSFPGICVVKFRPTMSPELPILNRGVTSILIVCTHNNHPAVLGPRENETEILLSRRQGPSMPLVLDEVVHTLI